MAHLEIRDTFAPYYARPDDAEAKAVEPRRALRRRLRPAANRQATQAADIEARAEASQLPAH